MATLDKWNNLIACDHALTQMQRRSCFATKEQRGSTWAKAIHSFSIYALPSFGVPHDMLLLLQGDGFSVTSFIAAKDLVVIVVVPRLPPEPKTLETMVKLTVDLTPRDVTMYPWSLAIENHLWSRCTPRLVSSGSSVQYPGFSQSLSVLNGLLDDSTRMICVRSKLLQVFNRDGSFPRRRWGLEDVATRSAACKDI